MQPVAFADFVNRDDARMIESRNRVRLLPETPDAFRIGGKFQRQNLDRYLAF
jgi:hypothetical protein